MTDLSNEYFNPSHLDHLSEDVPCAGSTYRLVHIYAAAPDYHIEADPEEGTSCVDDVARAAVVFLRHFEMTGDAASRVKAEKLLRFVMYMQNPEGLFYNFVINRELEINRDHPRSTAARFEWWACRAVWALGTGLRALSEANPEFAGLCRDHLRRAWPHIEGFLAHYPQTDEYLGRTVPTWLVNGDGADVTSELLLGLTAWNQAEPSPALQMTIARFAEGIAMMRYGSMNTFPYGMHASNRDGWHKWGNAQTQALVEAGLVTSAKLEAEQFYPRLLVEGFLHSIAFDGLHAVQYFGRIAYGIRAVAVGLIRLFEATGKGQYVIMAGLAASWFMGNNHAGEAMYDPRTGRCFDGLDGKDQINRNSGAESTTEALYTFLEVGRHPEARSWLHVRGDDPVRSSRGDGEYLYRVFTRKDNGQDTRVALVMNLSQERFELMEGERLDSWLSNPSA